MSVRQSLLAILAQGPCYGYQLRAEFERRTGAAWPLNVGQIYNTLERLERDGLVAKGDIDEHGHVYYAITDAGRRDAEDWLAAPLAGRAGARDELAVKIALALSLPGVDAASLVATERHAAQGRLDDLRATAPASDLAAALVHDRLVTNAAAEVAWLDQVERRLSQHPPAERVVALSPLRPKRGRPARVA
jgi:DNA-binding PadR family transcriptional regulator